MTSTTEPTGATLPDDLETLVPLIRSHTGDITEITPTDRGSSATTLLTRTATGTQFVKAVPNRPGGRRDSLLREAAINPYVTPVSPPMRWQAENTAWVALGFEAIQARPADFAPGSSDLPAVIDMMTQVCALPLPAPARDWPETRWNRHVPDNGQALLDGDAVLYTDINPDNVQIATSGTGAWVVDWAWPTRGAALINPACLIVQLIAAGHTPHDAERQLTGIPAWDTADPAAVNVFGTANLSLYRAFADRHPDAEWLTAMVDATHAWLEHRDVPATDQA